MDLAISTVALIVSIISLGLSYHFWRQTFRPIVTVAVKTNSGGNVSIFYDLIVRNSGSIPAKNIRLIADKRSLEMAINKSASQKDRETWLECFDPNNVIPILQDGNQTGCSFGLTSKEENSFWIYKSTLTITVEYEGWFGSTYRENQRLVIRDSISFTDGSWS